MSTKFKIVSKKTWQKFEALQNKIAAKEVELVVRVNGPEI